MHNRSVYLHISSKGRPRRLAGRLPSCGDTVIVDTFTQFLERLNREFTQVLCKEVTYRFGFFPYIWIVVVCFEPYLGGFDRNSKPAVYRGVIRGIDQMSVDLTNVCR